VWADNAGELASLQAGNWLFIEPRDGMRLLDRSSGQIMLYRDGWTAASVPTVPSGGTTIDDEARTAIAELVEAMVNAGILPQP
jgi:hypothetical protein